MSWFTQTISALGFTVPSVIVETGTYMGHGVESYIGNFEKIYSIELNETLYNQALQKFSNFNNVFLIHGDSADQLSKNDFGSEPVLFYLDAHFCGKFSSGGCGSESPLVKEIEAISKRMVKGDIVVIDDMRLMGKAEWEGTEGSEMWPRTFLDWSTLTKDDVINAFKQPRFIHSCTDIDRLIVVI